MPPFIILIIIYFLIVSFLADSASQTITNPFLAYYDIQLRFILNNLNLFILGLLIITLAFILLKNQSRGFVKSYTSLLQKIFVTSFIGSLVTLIILFIIAVVEINFLSLIIYSNFKLLGIESDSEKIINKLVENRLPSTVIAVEKTKKSLPLAIAIASSGKDSFYGGRIIPNFPHIFILPSKTIDNGVLMVGNTIIVNNIDSEDFENVSPYISDFMIKKYFDDKNIKSFPKVSLLSKDQYVTFRQKDYENKLKKFDEVVLKIQENKNSLINDIENQKIQLIEIETNLRETSNQKEKDYTKCINTGFYKMGIYYKTYSKAYCQEQILELEELIKSINREVVDLKENLKLSQKQLEQYDLYEKFYISQKNLTGSESSFISFEFGTFNPPDDIKISQVFENSSQSLADYFELIVHEYFHYASYSEEGKKLGSSFFEEGLAEFFARKVIKSSLGINTNLGYPLNVKIIEQITKRISESDLIDIYLANDQEKFENLMDRVYGKNFYRDNFVLFETLHYSTDTNQLLTIANELMGKVGGEALTEDDLKTTQSYFH